MILRQPPPSFVAPLFVPAVRPDRFAKAADSGADAIIVDLEDAVPIESKVAARGNLASIQALQVPAFIRINGAGTPWHQDDLDVLARLGAVRVCVPKVETIELLASIVTRLGPATQILAQIETAAGVQNAAAIAAHPNVQQLAFGPADFFLDMGGPSSRALALHVLARLAVASRAAGKPLPLDGPTFILGDTGELDEECSAAAAHGAGGKLCIHPSQIRPTLAAFRPSEQELAWARLVVEMDQGGAAMIVAGQMIDAPIVARAKALLGRAAGPTSYP